MNLDELEEAHRKLNAYDEPFVGHELAHCTGLINRAFPALLALARDGERYRWLRENLGTKVSHWFCTDRAEKLDAAIDAAMKERT